jgi:hypothetical protein
MKMIDCKKKIIVLILKKDVLAPKGCLWHEACFIGCGNLLRSTE